MQRVSVVGTSGSGKSTLARELAALLGVPHLELDSVFHQPGWEPLPAEEFRAIVTAKAAGDSWTIDGNYGAVRPIVWARADTVIWLDLPKRTVMRQVTWRTLRRATYTAAAADPDNTHLTFIRLTSRREITRFLAEARREASRL